jgi:hypothetical protein
MAHKSQKLQFEIVAVLGLLLIFSIFWHAAFRFVAFPFSGNSSHRRSFRSGLRPTRILEIDAGFGRRSPQCRLYIPSGGYRDKAPAPTRTSL